MPRPLGSKNKPKNSEIIEEPSVPDLVLNEKVRLDKIVQLFYASNLDMKYNEKSTLLKYLSAVDNTITCEYRPSEKSPEGRMYTSFGFQHLSKSVLHQFY